MPPRPTYYISLKSKKLGGSAFGKTFSYALEQKGTAEWVSYLLPATVTTPKLMFYLPKHDGPGATHSQWQFSLCLLQTHIKCSNLNSNNADKKGLGKRHDKVWLSEHPVCLCMTASTYLNK